MTATMTDKLLKASSGTRPNPTTLTSQKGVGDAILNADDLTGWATDTPITFVLFKIDTSGNEILGTRSDWKGIVSGNTITQLALTAGVDSIYPSGSPVIAVASARWADDLIGALLASLNQNGTLKDAVITNTMIADSAVVGSKLATSAIKLGYAQITSNFTSSGADNTLLDVTGLSSAFTVPAGGRDVEVVVKLGGIKTDAAAGTVMTLAVVEGSTVLDSIVWNQKVANYYEDKYFVARISAPSAGAHTYKVQFSKSAGNVTAQAAATGSAGFAGPSYIMVKAA